MGGRRAPPKGKGRGARTKAESDPSASECSEDSYGSSGGGGGRSRGHASVKRAASARGKKRQTKDWGGDDDYYEGGGRKGQGQARGFFPPLNSNGQPLVAKVVSKFKGVTWDHSSYKWQANSYEGGVVTSLGLYETQEEAARAYDACLVKAGRKDKLNFPANHVRDPSTLSKKSRATSGHKITSQYKGVSWNSACSKWVAVLWDRELKRARHIGSYESEEDAARAFDREAIKMLGTDAGLNFRESLDDYMATNGGVDAEMGDWSKVSRKASNPTPASRAPPDPTPMSYKDARGSGRRQVKRRRMDDDFIVDDDEEGGDDDGGLVEEGRRKAGGNKNPNPNLALHQQPVTSKGQGEVGAIVNGLPSISIFQVEESGEWAAALIVPGKSTTVLGHRDTESDARSLAHRSLAAALAPDFGQVGAIAMASTAKITTYSSENPLGIDPLMQHMLLPAPSQHMLLPAPSVKGSVEVDEGEGGEMEGDADDPDFSLEDEGYEEERGFEGRGRGGGGGGGGGGKGKRAAKASGGAAASEMGTNASTLVPGGNPTNRGKSLFRGVSWCEKVKKWRALLWDGHKQRFLGHFTSDSEAARAYDRALVDLKGGEAKTNFPLADYI